MASFGRLAPLISESYMCALAPLQLDAYSNRSRLAQVLQHEVPQQSDLSLRTDRSAPWSWALEQCLFGTQLVLHIRKFQKLLRQDLRAWSLSRTEPGQGGIRDAHPRSGSVSHSRHGASLKKCARRHVSIFWS